MYTNEDALQKRRVTKKVEFLEEKKILTTLYKMLVSDLASKLENRLTFSCS